MHIFEPGLADSPNGAVLSSSNTIAPSMPLSYAQTIQPTDRVRFTDLTQTIRFTVDLSIPLASGQYVSWDSLYLLFNNSTSAGTVTVSASPTSIALAISAPTYTVTFNCWPSPSLKPFFPRVHSRLTPTSTSPRTEPYLAVTISDAANPSTYFEFGRLYVGLGVHLPTPERYPSSIPYPSETERLVRSEGGQDYVRPAGIDEALTAYPVLFSGKALGVGLTPLQQTARALQAASDFYTKVTRVIRLRGVSKDVLIDFDPTDTHNAMEKILYGRIVNIQQPQLIAPSTYQVTLNFKGMR